MQRALSWVVEYGIYLLVVFLFTSKGNAFRSFGLYAPPIALLTLGIIEKRLPVDLKNPLFVILLAMSISAILSSILGDDPVASFIFLKKTYLKDILIFLVLVSSFSSPERLRRLVSILAFTTAIFVFLTFYDYFTKALLPDGSVDYTNVRGYSSSLAFYMPFIPCAILFNKQRLWRISLLIILICGVPAMLLTGARGGWISLALSLGIWGIFFLIHGGRRMLTISLAGLLVTIFLFVAFIPAPHVAKRLKDFSSSHRVDLRWTAYLELYLSSKGMEKLFGYGLDKETMVSHYSEWYRWRVGGEMSQGFAYNPHNMYLYLLFKQGAVGLLLYLTMMLVSLYGMITLIVSEKDLSRKAIGLSMLLPFIGEYVIRGLVEDLRFIPLGLLLGMYGAYMKMERRITPHNGNRGCSCPIDSRKKAI